MTATATLGLLPVWPILLGVGILLTAFLMYCVVRFGDVDERHTATRNVGVFWCRGCHIECDDANLCWCCKETG